MVEPLSVHLLVPFFLYANLSVNPSDWKNGPEVIYDASITSHGPVSYKIPDPNNIGKSIEAVDPKNYVSYNTTMKLKCRPKTESAIICHFENPRMLISSIQNGKNGKIINDSKTYSDNHAANPPQYFEYLTTRDVIEESRAYTASSSMSDDLKNLVRVFIDALRVPSFFTQLREGLTKILLRESSTFGTSCETFYRVDLRKFDELPDEKKNEKSYGLFIKDPNSSLGPIEESMVILRDKNDFESCQNAYSRFYPGYLFRRDTWQNTMIITKNTFSSSATTFIQIIKPEISMMYPKYFAKEILNLRLEKIVPATGPLPQIPDPKSFSISGREIYHSYSAKRYFFP